MPYAYDPFYLDDAMKNLGEAVEYAAYQCGLQPDRFMELFIAGGMAHAFERGVPGTVCGLSGTEMACEVIALSGIQMDLKPPIMEFGYSPEYWSGWVIAYYQWKSCLRFRDIHAFLPLQEVVDMYPALHEASEERFAAAADHIRERRIKEVRLGQLRRMNAYSQSILAQRSHVSLRMIQQYEQGAKDIRKASVSSIQNLARTLGCGIEDLVCRV